jgi:hypothetical protein
VHLAQVGEVGEGADLRRLVEEEHDGASVAGPLERAPEREERAHRLRAARTPGGRELAYAHGVLELPREGLRGQDVEGRLDEAVGRRRGGHEVEVDGLKAFADERVAKGEEELRLARARRADEQERRG